MIMKFFIFFLIFSNNFRILRLYHWGFAFYWRYTGLYQKDMTIRPVVFRNVTRTLSGLKWTDRGFGENSGISPLDIEMGTKTRNPKWTEKLDIIRYWSFFAPTTDLVANFLTLRTPELTRPICVKLVKIGLKCSFKFISSLISRHSCSSSYPEDASKINAKNFDFFYHNSEIKKKWKNVLNLRNLYLQLVQTNEKLLPQNLANLNIFEFLREILCNYFKLLYFVFR